MLMLEELVIWLSPFFSLSFLLKDLLWTGLLFLLHRHLHQSGALTMEALQDPPPDPVEGMDEDIADKVDPGQWDQRTMCRQHRQPVSGHVLRAVASGCGLRGDMLGEVHLGCQDLSWQAQQEVVMAPQGLTWSSNSPPVLQHFAYVEGNREDGNRAVSARGCQPAFVCGQLRVH